MKKIIILFLAFTILFMSTSCGKRIEEKSIKMEPKVSQMKAICELAVMECYFHNVAKFKEEDSEGILWWKKDKHFWIEYSGIVKLGIDVSLVNIEVNDSQIIITIPDAKVLGCKVDSSSLNENSFIVDRNSADINAEDEVKAFEEAQIKLEETASNDKALLAAAQQRAQSLLEDYITNIGDVVGKQYIIKWVYLDEDGKPIETVATSETIEETEKP